MTIWPEGIVDVVAVYFFSLKLITPFIVIAIFLSSLDDFFIDLVYFFRNLMRALFVYTRHSRWDVANIRPHEEKRLALMIPAWDEADVIANMLHHLTTTYSYQNYHIFVGIYPNDPKTFNALKAFFAAHPTVVERVTVVTNATPGPTSKADCLNTIYTFASGLSETPEIYVIHDAEDLVDPYEAWVFTHLIPKKAMVQIPVQPLLRPGPDMIGGHYADEFAETHSKDLIVREALSGSIPSAGVGCAFAHSALAKVATERGGKPFNIHSLTEDYDLALTLGRLGLKTVFVRLKHPCTALDKKQTYLATKAYFPNRMGAAIRQKSRWLTGITLQSWDTLGWQGNLWDRYMLMRDRKILLTSILNIIAIFLFINGLIQYSGPHLIPGFPVFTALTDESDPFLTLMVVNMVFMMNRLAQRFWYVSKLYGSIQGVLSIVRTPTALIINFAATVRALWIYKKNKRSGSIPQWDKTQHVFPDMTTLPKPLRKTP